MVGLLCVLATHPLPVKKHPGITMKPYKDSGASQRKEFNPWIIAGSRVPSAGITRDVSKKNLLHQVIEILTLF